MNNVETCLKCEGLLLRKATNYPLTNHYFPECDAMLGHGDKYSSYYPLLVVIISWIVNMGRIGITYETSIMSHFVAVPRRGQLQKLFHMLNYLKLHPYYRIVMDPTYPDID